MKILFQFRKEVQRNFLQASENEKDEIMAIENGSPDSKKEEIEMNEEQESELNELHSQLKDLAAEMQF